MANELTLEEFERLERYRLELLEYLKVGNKVERFIEIKGELVKTVKHIPAELNRRLFLESDNIAKFLETVKIK